MAHRYNYTLGTTEYTSGKVTIYEYQRGLLYHNGRIERVLTAGRYRLWPWSHATLIVVDIRRTSVQIADQKLLTKDQITVGLNLLASYEVADPLLARQAVADAKMQLYEDVQLAARAQVGAVTVDELLEERVALNARLLESVQEGATTYGLHVMQVAIKDIILAPRVRDLLMKEVEARRIAQATLIGAREEVAAMRALSNAARMVQDNPALLRLRELDVARGFSANSGNTLIMGVNGVLPVGARGGDEEQTSDFNRWSVRRELSCKASLSS